MKITITLTFPPDASENSISIFKRRAVEVLRHDMLEVIKATLPEEDQPRNGGEVEVVIS